MFFCVINDEGVGIFDDYRYIIPLIKQGQEVFENFSFLEIEDYIRSNLSFDRLYDLGWEIDIDMSCLNHFHTVDNEKMIQHIQPQEPVPKGSFCGRRF